MSRMKVPLKLWAPLLLCLPLLLGWQGSPGVSESARQLASSADDAAVTLEARREALSKLEEAARLFLGADDKIEAARVLNRAGRLHLLLNEPHEALASHRRALELLAERPAPEAEVDSLNGMGAAYMLLKKKAEAGEVLRRAVGLSREAGYTLGQAQALLTLSDQQNFDNHSLAVQTAREALALWQSADDKPGLARTYAKLGEFYMAQSLLSDSAENYERALGLWRELNDVPAQAKCLIMLGFIEHRRGEWARSMALHSQARGLLDERAEPYMMGQIAAATAEAFNQNGLPEAGLKHYQRALEYYRLTQDPNAVAYVTWGMGVTHYLSGNYAEAEAYFRQSLAGVDDDPLEAVCYEYLGAIYIATGAYDLALQNLRTALAILTRAGNPVEAARVRALMGQVSERRGQPEQARRHYREALATFERLSIPVNQAAAYYALGGLELKEGNLREAEVYLRQSVEVTENIRRGPAGSDLTAAFSATVYERYQKYVECLMRLDEAHPGQGFAARAFETSELARARSLAQLLRDTQTNLLPGLDTELAAREKMLRQSLRVKEDQRIALLAGAAREEELARLEAEAANLEAEYEQAIKTIRSTYPAFDRLTRPSAWDLGRIQEQVVADEQTVLLSYSLGAERSHVWAVTRDGFKSYVLPAEEQVGEATQKVYQLLKDAPGATTEVELDAATQGLGRMVLSPVASELNRRRVVVVADGALNYIPFQILPSPAAAGEPLLADHEVVNAPSASVLGELRQEAARRRPAPKVLAAFGNPVFSPGDGPGEEAGGGDLLAGLRGLSAERWRQAARDIELEGDSFDPAKVERLFYAGRELANLRDVAADGHTLVAEAHEATRERLMGTDLTQYAILHIATHGLLDPKRPENSGLVLSTVDGAGRTHQGFVGLQDIYSLVAPVNLVVLSACRTGLGKDVRGEGLLGLTRGFMYAGASSVVASLWEVDDEATAELMRHFYLNLLRERMPPAEALRAAQNSIRQRPQWRSPHYWAAFTLQGEYRQPIQAPPPAPSAALPLKVAGGALLALLSGAGWWYLRRRLRAARRGA